MTFLRTTLKMTSLSPKLIIRNCLPQPSITYSTLLSIFSLLDLDDEAIKRYTVMPSVDAEAKIKPEKKLNLEETLKEEDETSSESESESGEDGDEKKKKKKEKIGFRDRKVILTVA